MKHKRAFAAAFSLALLFTFAPSPVFSLEQVKNSWVDEGRDLVARRLYQQAIRHATTAIEKYSVPCQLELNAVSQSLAQLKTDADCDALISNANNKAESFSVRGIAYASTGKLDLAAKDFDASLRSFPESSLYICNKGRLLLKQGKLNEAEAAARKAIKIEPKMLDAHKLLGSVLNHQNKYKEANAEFNICRALSEKSARGQHLSVHNCGDDSGIEIEPQQRLCVSCTCVCELGRTQKTFGS